MTSDRVPVAIIGGGFSGTMLAAQLARRGISSALIDGSGRTGLGTAYSTTEPAHLLNVRAEMMSAWADDPDHFARAYEDEGGDRRGFAQRLLFGRYLRKILDEARGVETVRAFARSVRREDGHWAVELDVGRVIEADALVLAHGNQLPEPVGDAGSHLINDPWGADAQAAVRDLAETDGDVLIVGTSLTMVDLALSLDAAGHRGRIVALSRRGLVPRSHADYQPAPVEADAFPRGDLLKLWRWLKRRGAEVGWRAAVDSLRPHSHALWQSFDERQQRRFLRHARPWWDVLRHRIAPEVAATIVRMVEEGRLEIIAGRIVGMEDAGDAISVEYRRRGRSETEAARFAYVFNSTGPLGSIERTRDPLLRGLLDDGLIEPDQLGIGIAVDDHSRAKGAERLWAMGPLTKGRYWEMIAVPDIRGQAAAVAEDIEQELGR
jgi:uncharacterized NAD(P)/FAD-binding protein YdhS